MKVILKSILTITVAVAVTACTMEAILPEAMPEDPVYEAADEDCIVQGTVIVKFSQEMAEALSADLAAGNVMTKSSELNSLVNAHGITKIEKYFPEDPRWTERHHKAGLDRWYEITYDPEALTATRAAGDLKSIPGVEKVDVVRKTREEYDPDVYYVNDPIYLSDDQYFLHGEYDINCELVWENYTFREDCRLNQVRVGVHTGGVDNTHEDLIDNLVPGEEGGSVVISGSTYTHTMDTLGFSTHDTMCGGIIGAVGGNGKGVASVAGGYYDKGIAGVRLVDLHGGAAKCWVYGADNGVNISMNSWSYVYDDEESARNGHSSSDEEAIDYFVEYAGCDNDGNQLETSLMKGGFLVFAAGNQSRGWGYPAGYEKCFAVAATGSDGLKAGYSNYGEDFVEMCAPGSSIWTTSLNNEYGSNSGTSFACPVVCGVAALLVEYLGGQGFTNDMLWECLVEGGVWDKISSAYYIGPFVDALNSIEYWAPNPPSSIDSYTTSISGNTVFFNFAMPARNDVRNSPADGVLLCGSKNRSSLENLDPENIPSGVNYSFVSTKDCVTSEATTLWLTVDDFNSDYYVTCIPYNFTKSTASKDDTYAAQSPIMAVSTGSNNDPVITPLSYDSRAYVAPAGSVDVVFNIADPDMHDLTVTLERGTQVETLIDRGGNTYVLNLRGNAVDQDGLCVDSGDYVCSIKATDPYGASVDFKVNYTVLENHAPVALNKLDDNVEFKYGSTKTNYFEWQVSGSFVDYDGEDLVYEVTNTDPSVASAGIVSVNGESVLRITAAGKGATDVTVSAYDTRKASCSQTVNVTVKGDATSGSATVGVYPNPVRDKLYVSTTEEDYVSVIVKISSLNGTTVFSGSYAAKAGNPAEVDLSGLAPGTYTAKIRCGTKTLTKEIVKL